MAPNPPLTSRVDPAVVARIDACVNAHNARAEPGAPQIDRGGVVRLLVMRALPILEAELGIAPPKGATGKRSKVGQKGGKAPRKA